MYGVDSVWTELRIAVLKELWASGASASQIAAELGEVSRNSVLGKVHRLKLPKRVQAYQPRADKTPRVHKRQRFREVPPMPDEQHNQHVKDFIAHAPLLQAAPYIIALDDKCTLMELAPDKCRWPLWSDAQPERLYCGAPTDGVYCGHHTRLAWRRRS